MFNQVLQGDSWKLVSELPDESVDCVVTSPPYWGLRDYGAEGQAGLEGHPQEWIDKMVELCRLLRPKLKKSGVMFWNIGETYFGGKGKSSYETEEELGNRQESGGTLTQQHQALKFDRPSDVAKQDGKWLQPKQMLGLPWRFAIKMQDDGWILRNCVCWWKPNHMPSSVKDRLSNSYEYVFMFVKNRKYYFDLDSIREPHQTPVQAMNQTTKISSEMAESMNSPRARIYRETKKDQQNCDFEYRDDLYNTKFDAMSQGMRLTHRLASARAAGRDHDTALNHPSGKNPGDVWRITTRPHPFAHFACFPDELAERCIKAACPQWVCNKCGQPRERIIKIHQLAERENKRNKTVKSCVPLIPEKGWQSEHETTRWTDCGCNAGFSGGIVLDPFAGSGTTGLVALKQNKKFIGIELNKKYIEIAEKRLKPFLCQTKL